jgi:Zn-dependent M28 family amino/carboxypeptidase
MMMMPGKSYRGALLPLTAQESQLRDRLREHVVTLAQRIGERNTDHYHALQQAQEYVTAQFHSLGLPTRQVSYRVGSQDLANVEAELKGVSRPQEIVLVGAHYDSVAGSPGANDNGSGVAALLELARLFKDSRHRRTLRFVAFVNEEPPFFHGGSMGSVVYAQRARQHREQIVAMLSLETIGYYSDTPKSQRYPAALASLFPDTGNFIGFVGDLASVSLVRRVIGSFRGSTRFPSQGVAAPGWIPGVGWSDQWAFWQQGYRGVMITDTAPFRYPYYHQSSDTPDKIDYDRMARVVSGVRHVLYDLARE